MAEADEPNGPPDAAEPPRKVARGVPIIDGSIEGVPDRLHGEVNQSWQPTATPSPPNSPPPMAPNTSHDLASTASEQLLLRTSAEHLLMLTSCAQQPADTSATQVCTPSRGHSPSNLCAKDALVDMAVADARPNLDQATSSEPAQVDTFHLVSCSYNYQVFYLLCGKQVLLICQQKRILGVHYGLFLHTSFCQQS